MVRVPHRALSGAAIAAVLAVGLAAGCGGKASPSLPPRPTFTVAVTPSRTSNQGRPVHALVRAVTLKQFAEDPDARIAQLVVSPDESVLATFVVFPGVAQSLTIDAPAKGPLAVYFLFTNATGTSWKQLFEGVPASIRIELGEDAIEKASATASGT